MRGWHRIDLRPQRIKGKHMTATVTEDYDGNRAEEWMQGVADILYNSSFSDPDSRYYSCLQSFTDSSLFFNEKISWLYSK